MMKEIEDLKSRTRECGKQVSLCMTIVTQLRVITWGCTKEIKQVIMSKIGVTDTFGKFPKGNSTTKRSIIF